ncbi:MAG: 2-hydroxyacyl-CoA dehydratase [Dehalococcoidia bacterium]|nr:2-hydroxyacyl-CoA dehydratase [Dehalococcoidia bacterium]
MQKPKKVIGITTTVPSEVLLAAGYTPLDLNNIFMNDPDPGRLVRKAERAGFPLNTCAWIKGLYSVCVEQHIDTVLCVTTGDCSNTSMLMEVLKMHGLTTIPFAYPDHPDIEQMQTALEKLADRLGTDLPAAENMRRQLAPCRTAAGTLDRLTWEDNCISGAENHYWLVSSSDFNQDYLQYQADVQNLIECAKQRTPYPADELRLAFIGVPPVYGKDLYPFIEQNGARVVYNEIQRQFAMLSNSTTLAGQYTDYTYPFDIGGRIRDIECEIERRSIDGVIHYVQAFCHRAIGDIVLRNRLSIPILTIEGNTDFVLSQHLKTRLEAFMDMLFQIKLSNQAAVHP